MRDGVEVRITVRYTEGGNEGDTWICRRIVVAVGRLKPAEAHLLRLSGKFLN